MNQNEDQINILVVDDNEEIRNILRILLESEGYHIEEAGDGETALEKVNEDLDLIILDIMMPGMSGMEVCKKIRETYTMPILFLTAKSQDADKSLGLLLGADDYLVKPFSHSELTARVKSILRRYTVYKGKEKNVGNNFFVYGSLKVNKDINEVFRTEPGGKSESLDLSNLEYQILRLLISTPQTVFSAETIYETIWQEPYLYSSNATIMVHIRNLRAKLEEDPSNPRHVITVWGKGYRLE